MTTKQMKAIKIMAENGGVASKAMLQAGYSEVSAKTPSKLTNSKAYKSMYAPMLKEHGVTINQYIKNIGDAMQATIAVYDNKGKLVKHTPNHQTRLSGNKQAERFLFKAEDKDNGITADDVQALANASDDVELTHVLFKRST